MLLLGQEGVNRSIEVFREPVVALQFGHTLAQTRTEIRGRGLHQQVGDLLEEQLGVREGVAEQQRGERYDTQHNNLDPETLPYDHGRDSIDTQYFSS